MNNIQNIVDYLRDEFELDKEDIIEMIDELFINLDSTINDIENCDENDKWDILRKKGHSIRGASGNVGANYIAEIAKNLETQAENQDDKYIESIEKIKKAIEELKYQYTIIKI